MSDDDLLKIRNFGDKSLVELKEKLAENGITSAGQRAAEGPGPVAVGALTPDDLSDLMGSGDDDDGSLPVGMTYDDDSLIASSADAESGDETYEEYE